MSECFGKYDVYAVAGSVYCYKDSTVLRNKLGIRDGIQLRQIESDISAARQTELIGKPVNGHFTANHLCTIHRRLLGDVYSFAGHYRREDIAKGDTRFVGYADIADKLKKLLDDLHAECLLNELPFNGFINRSAYYMAELNYIHPFREGNGRTIREFMRQLCLQNGCTVEWDAVHVDELLQAMIDSVYDTTHLEQVLHKCVLRKKRL